MPQLTGIGSHLNKLPQEQREAITSLIDIQTEANVERVLAKLDGMTETIKALDSKVDAKFDALNHKIAAIYWFIGAIVALGVALTRILPIFHF